MSKGHLWAKVNNFFRFLKSSIFICLISNLTRICISGKWIQPTIIFEVNIGQKVNKGQISKIANFHLIDLKFEDIGVYVIRRTASRHKLFGIALSKHHLVNAKMRKKKTNSGFYCSSFMGRAPTTHRLHPSFTPPTWITFDGQGVLGRGSERKKK